MPVINYYDLFDRDGLVDAFKRAEQANAEFARNSIALNKQIKQSFDEVITQLNSIKSATGKSSGSPLAGLAKDTDRYVESAKRQKAIMDLLNSSVDVNERSIQELRLMLAGLKKEYDSLVPTEANFAARQQEIANRAKEANTALQMQETVLKEANKQVGVAAGSYRQLSNETAKMKQQLREMSGAYDLTTGKINQHNAAAVAMQRQIMQNDRALKAMDASMGNYQRNVGNYAGAVRTLSNTAKEAFVAVTGISSAFQAVSEAISIIDRMERLNIALENASGSSARFAQNQQMVIGLVNQTGTNIESVTKSYVKFTAATQGTRLEGQAANQIFSTFTKTFAALGASSVTAERGLLAIEQMISKNTVGAEELRQQLGDALPGSVRLFTDAYKELHNMSSLTTGEFMKLMKEGKVLSEDILPVVARRLEEIYGEKAQRNLQTISGAWTNMTNQLKLLLDYMNDDGVISKFFAGIQNGLANTLRQIREANGVGNWVETAAPRWAAASTIIPALATGNVKVAASGFKGMMLSDEDRRRNAVSNRISSPGTSTDERAKILQDEFMRLSEIQKKYDNSVLKRDEEKYEKQLKNQQNFFDSIVNNTLIAQGKMEALDRQAKIDSGELIENKDGTVTANPEWNKKGGSGTSTSDKLKKTTSQVEKLAIQIDNLRDILTDQILAGGKGSVLDVKPETLKSWDDLYEKLRKVYEAVGQDMPKNLEDLNEKLHPGLVNQIKNDANFVYGRPEKWEEPKVAPEEDPSKMREFNVKKLIDAEGAYNTDLANLDMMFGDSGKLRGASDEAKNKIAKIYKEIYDLRTQGDNDYTRNRERSLREQVRKEEEAAANILAIRRKVTEQSIELGAEMVNALFEINKAQREADMQNLQKQMEYDLELAGDNQDKKDAIRKSYVKKEREMRQQQARADKAQAAFSIVLNTAKAVAAALPVVPLAILAAAMGAVQLAVVLSKPIPAFAKGTDYAPEGPALVAEEGPELRKSGDKYTLYEKPQIANLKRGDKIITAKKTQRIMAEAYLRQEFLNDAMQRSITGNKTVDDIIAMSGPTIISNNNIDYDRLIAGFKGAMSDRPVHEMRWDERGFTEYMKSKAARIQYLTKRNM